MKKLLLLLLLISFSVTAQIKKGELAYTAINIANDPHASIKEEGINISLELERIQNFGYIKAGFETFPALEGGYNYLYTAFGGYTMLPKVSENIRLNNQQNKYKNNIK